MLMVPSSLSPSRALSGGIVEWADKACVVSEARSRTLKTQTHSMRQAPAARRFHYRDLGVQIAVSLLRRAQRLLRDNEPGRDIYSTVQRRRRESWRRISYRPRPLARGAGPPSVSRETMAMDGLALLLASETGKRSPRQPQVFQCNYAVKHHRQK